jgi:hypothetical protein
VRRLVLIGVLVLALVAGDAVARSAAQSAIESGVKANVQGVATVHARIHSFPFSGRLLAAGQISRLDLDLDQVAGHGIEVAKLAVRATGLRLDRNVLLGKAHVRITGVDSVSVTATITEDEIRTLTHADVRLLPGRATVTVAGRTLTAGVTAASGRIRLTVAGLATITVPAPDAVLFPCTIEMRVITGAVQASCTSDHLPTIVIDAVGSVDLKRSS